MISMLQVGKLRERISDLPKIKGGVRISMRIPDYKAHPLATRPHTTFCYLVSRTFLLQVLSIETIFSVVSP